jgi:tetratricopeptide (TPR) repeat protein
LQDFIKQNPQSDTRVRLDRLLLEAVYPTEIATSLGGVYPDREIYTPTPDDLTKCFNEYMADAQRRYQHDVQFPNEPKQIRPGENLALDEKSGRLSISGQIAVMSINGLLTKVIFDHNPKNEFFVEESFPLDWMYPYQTPYGIIMKINREPLKELTEDIVRRDHEFWTQYSQRLIGNWITYDTPIKDIAAWVEQVYLRRNFRGFTGDRAFVRDDQAQKSFSKLRSSIAGVYNWRWMQAKPGTPDYQRMMKEADFAFRQAFAFCPYSPEAVFRYTNMLLTQQRFDDAYVIASTCLKLDPYNDSVKGLVINLETWRKQQAQNNPAQLEQTLAERPDDFQAILNVAMGYLQLRQTDQAVAVLDRVLNSPKAEPNAYRALLQAYVALNNTGKIQAVVDKLAAQYQANRSNLDAGTALGEGYHLLQRNDLATQTLNEVLNHPNLDANAAMLLAQQYAALIDYPHLETTLEKLSKLAPGSPEAWYDLASLKASLGKNAEALPALKQALELSAARLKKDPKARNLVMDAKSDPRFAALRQVPEVRQMLGEK